jgi:hypothetical protein
MLLLSVILVGWWFEDWFTALVRYTQYAKSVWPVGFLWDFSPFLVLGLLTAIGAAIYKLRRDENALFAATIPIQVLLFPQTLIWGLSILCVPLVMVWNWGMRKWVIGMWLLGWILFLSSTDSEWWKYQIVIVSLITLLLVYLRKNGKGMKDELQPAS